MKNEKLPWYLNALLWIFIIAGGFVVILFIRGCLYAVGILKDTRSSSKIMASNLFGILPKKIVESDDTPVVKLPLYKMLEDYTFFGYSDTLNYTKKFKKDEHFYGIVKQFDASHGSDKSLNLVFPTVMQDFIEMTGQALPTGISLGKCRLLTKEESDAHYAQQQALV